MTMTVASGGPAGGGLAVGSAGHASSLALPRGALAGMLLFIGGCLTSWAAYGSPDPMLAAGLLYVLCIGALKALRIGGEFERRAFGISFCVCWFWAGISALYAEYLGDPSQNSLDAAYFLEMVTKGDAIGLSALELVFLQENGGAMLLWRSVYDVFALLGFDKARYVGVAANTAMVSLSAVTGVRMVDAMFGRDAERMRRYILLFSSCGLFWMFAAMHLRDSAALLAVSLLTLYWIRFLAKPGKAGLWRLAVASAMAFFAFGMLRTEFVFVPVAMLAAGLLAIFMSSNDKAGRRRMLLWAAFLGLPAAAWLIVQVQSDLVQAILRGRETYNELTAAESGQGSLGNSLIMEQPLPIRLGLGFVYLLVFPVPFWSGFQEQTAYHLFKSLHALFMYGILPLAALSALHVLRMRSTVGAPSLFLLLVVCGFALGISYTSLENRHFGAFLVSLLVLSVVLDPRDPRVRKGYRAAAIRFLGSVVLVHLAWAAMKAIG